MSMELFPRVASQLALDVYEVNGGDAAALNQFLKSKVFVSGKPGKVMVEAEVGGRIVRAAKDSFGLCARGAGNYENDIFLIFRGTTEANRKADYFTDGRIGICVSKTGLPVHIGFNHAFNSMLPEIRQFIAQANPTGYVHCIGHSLGGAVASLAADWVSKNMANTPKLYTFGAPRVGTDFFVRSATNSIGQENFHRVYHRTDPVPMVALYPFAQAPYSIIGHHYIYSSEPLASADAHSMGKYVKSVDGQAWAQLSAFPEQPYTIENAVEQWLQSKSPVDSSSASFWRWVDAALVYVLKKVSMALLTTLQGSFIGLLTLADKIAYILKKGSELLDEISDWVELLMRKIMLALHMRAPASKKELTQDLMRRVLVRLAEESNRNARNALQKIE